MYNRQDRLDGRKKVKRTRIKYSLLNLSNSSVGAGLVHLVFFVKRTPYLDDLGGKRMPKEYTFGVFEFYIGRFYQESQNLFPKSQELLKKEICYTRESIDENILSNIIKVICSKTGLVYTKH